MKLTALPILLALLLISCEKDQLEPTPSTETSVPTPKEYIIVGDSVSNEIEFTSFSPYISMESVDFTEFYDLHFDSDPIADYRLKIHSAYPFAGNWFNGCSVRIECLNPEAEVSIDPLYADSLYAYPEQYELNDTLHQNAEWLSGNIFISGNGDVPNDGCTGPGCPNQSYGIWFGTTEKYIGVRLKKNLPILGWIKISLPSTNVNYGQTLVIEQYGYIP